MPQIPVYDQKVSIDAGGGTPTPQLSGIPASASGVGIAEGISKAGAAITDAASVVGQIVAHKQKLDSQEKVDKLSEEAALELQNHLHGEGGLLTRQGDAAKGITAGTYPADFDAQGNQTDSNGVKYKDSFDGFSTALAEKYLAKADTPMEKAALAKSLRAHDLVLRNAVIAHESQQNKIARAQASEAKVEALKNTGVDAVTVGDLQHVMDEGMAERENALKLAGHSDEAVISAVKMKTADEFAIAAVQANLDRDPEAAQALLGGVKSKLSNGVAAKLQDQIDGKMIAVRSDAIWSQIASDPAAHNPDNSIKIDSAVKIASSLASERPEKERMTLVKMAKEQAGIANAALTQQKQVNARGYLDGFSELRDKGVPFIDAEKLVLTKYGSAFGPSELDKLREQAVRIYQRAPESIDDRLTVMNSEQKRGYADAVNIIKTKYKNQTSIIPGEELPVKLSDAMIQELKQRAPKMTREQIMEWTNTQLKDVPTKPGYLGFLTGKTPAWQEERSLVSRYGTAAVAAASAELKRAKGDKLPTYVELEEKLRGR